MLFNAKSWSLDLSQQVFYRDGAPVRLQRGVMDLLLYIVRQKGRTIPKEELIDHVWGGRAVSDAALYNRVWALRRALGDVDGEDRHVSWDYGRGLRFTETTQPLGADAASDAGEVSRPVALRYDAPGGFLAVEDPDGMSARDALKRSGPIPDGDPMLDETVVKSLQPRPLIFQDPAEDP